MSSAHLLDLCPRPVDLLLARLLDRLFQLFLPFLDESGLLRLCLGPQRILRVQLVLQQLVVLAVVLLHVGGQLFLVRFLQLVDDVVILTVVFQLLLKLFNSLFKPFLSVHHLKAHVSDLGLVLLLHLGLPLLYFRLVIFKLFLCFPPLLSVPLLCLFYHLLNIRLFFSLFQGFLLFGNDVISLAEDYLNFLLVGARHGVLILHVLLVFGVQVEDDLGQLRYLL